MRQHEDTVTFEMAGILNEMRKNWKVNSQALRIFKNSTKRPDILITETGLENIIIENEIEPANPEHDAKDKLKLKYRNENDVSTVIAVQIPERFRTIKIDIKKEFESTDDLKYAVYNPDRFPSFGWLVGNLHNIAMVAQISSVPKSVVNKCVNDMKDTIEFIANLIDKSGTTTKENISKLLFQKQNEQTWKIAGLILSNAVVFHNNIAGEHGVKTIREITVAGWINLSELNGVWDRILDVNYFAIFDMAKKILDYIDDDTAQEIVEQLVKTSNQITRMGLTRSTDMYGSLIQRMITDRKTLASFYTLPESAALLAGLVVPSMNSKIFDDEESIKKIRIADFACGTGTLLTTMYRQIIMNYESRGHDMRSIHDEILGNSIIGFDVLPSAVHLTVSSLAGIFPKKTIKTTKIGTAVLGKKNDVLHLGSLDLIEDHTTHDEKGAFIIGNKEENFTNPGILHKSMDYVIMNPPFTSNTREGGKEGHAMFSSLEISKEMSTKMAKLEKKKFANTCANGNAGYATNFIAVADKKLKHGGTLGLILPSTIHYGSSWEDVRQLLRTKYYDIIIISIASSTTSNQEAAFSQDTDMNEIILIAKKESKSFCEKIDEFEKDIKYKENKISQLKSKEIKIQNREKISEYEKKISTLKKKFNTLSKNKRGKFISIQQRPNSILAANELCKSIHNQGEIIKIEDTPSSGSIIEIGGKSIGMSLDCSLCHDWWFVGVQDASLIQCAYSLKNGVLHLIGESNKHKLKMTVLGDSLGLSTRDIGSMSKSKNDYSRSPFNITPILPNIKPPYYALWNNNNETQTQMIVEPDKSATEKPDAEKEKIDKVGKTATRIHINRLNTFPSQYLVMMYTREKSFGGESLPNVVIPEKYEKTLTLWCNSTLGVLSYWASSGRQQLGRGIHSRTSLQNMPILDFNRLSDNQISEFDNLFDKYANDKLEKIKSIHKDKTRKKIDKDVLNLFNIDACLDDLRKRLCLEPSITGGNPDKELLQKFR